MNTYRMIQEHEFRMQQITKLREKNFLWNEIADFYRVSERTAYRWGKLKESIIWTKLKRGVKPKISEAVIDLVRSYALEDKPKTQQEMADYVFKELGIKISRPSLMPY